MLIELSKGEASFFLQPGERLNGGVQEVLVLSEDEAVVLRSLEAFELSDGTCRAAGDKWMVRGPCEYVASRREEVVARRKAIPLGENEGVYVRDLRSGQVRAVVGGAYMLREDEELWSKTVPSEMEGLIGEDLNGRPRDATRVVTYKVPRNRK